LDQGPLFPGVSNTIKFLRDEYVSPASNPSTWRVRGHLCPASLSRPVRHWWPYQQLGCCQHSFRDHWCTQAPSLG
jgi:hypothetical protein